MAQIHILDSETIDKIAAGEVVERPSSVVKELVENAIDAGASAVTVEAKDGGTTFIRVTDNGCGMEGSQLRTAFLRHATSKIENAGDLVRISSLGFRGEALSSIAAVAKVEVITTPTGSITGNRILLEGAKEVGFDEVGAPEGTTFLVRNLFFNTPVRRKFLKQPATEGGYIADLMEHLALSRPDVSFKLVLGGQTKFHTSGNGDLKEVIYRIYGRDAAATLVPIQAQRDGVRIEGYLGKPVQVRSNRNFEIYFINGRFIRSNVVARAIEEGYKEYLMQHKFPFCVLHITMDAGKVDVNVHPTKMDVRFADAIGFSNFLAEAVRGALQSREMIPEALLSTEKELREARKEEKKEMEKQATPEPFEQKRSQSYQVMEETKYTASQPRMKEFARNPVWERVKGAEQDAASSGLPEAGAAAPHNPGNAFWGQVNQRENASSDLTGQGNIAQANQTESAYVSERALTEAKQIATERAQTGQNIPEIPLEDAEVEEFIFKEAEVEETIADEQKNRETIKNEREIEEGTAEDQKAESKISEDWEVKKTIIDEDKATPGTWDGLRTAAPQGQIDESVHKTSEELEEEEPFFTETSELPEEDAGSGKVPENAAHESTQEQSYTGEQLNLFEEKILTVDNRSRFRIIGQVFETYWLIEFEEKLLMIDQHAAHEKVNYERLMKRYREKNVLSQGLMPPVIVSLSGQEESVLKAHLDTFTALGFEIEAFGGNEYALRSVPVDLYGCEEREMFLEVLDGLLDGTGFGSIRVIEEKIASMSCKAAVKGNNKLSVPEAETLIDELLTLENPYNCPHGRPIIVTISKTEMERKFKRIVN